MPGLASSLKIPLAKSHNIHGLTRCWELVPETQSFSRLGEKITTTLLLFLISLKVLPLTCWHSIKNSVLGILISYMLPKDNDFVLLVSSDLEVYVDLTCVPIGHQSTTQCAARTCLLHFLSLIMQYFE